MVVVGFLGCLAVYRKNQKTRKNNTAVLFFVICNFQLKRCISEIREHLKRFCLASVKHIGLRLETRVLSPLEP